MRSIVTSVLVLGLCCVGLPSRVGAQESAASDTTRANSLKAGAWALQFFFQDFISFGSFQGASFAAKKHTSDKVAWSLGFSFNGDYGDRDEVDHRLREDGSRDTTASDYHDDHYDIRAEVLYLRYPSPRSSLNLLYGAGPFVSRFHDERTTTSDYGFGLIYNEYFEAGSWDLGLTAVLGAEYFVTRRIGLIAQYGAEVAYRWREEERSFVRVEGPLMSRTETKSDSEGFRFGASRGRLGISAYFP